MLGFLLMLQAGAGTPWPPVGTEAWRERWAQVQRDAQNAPTPFTVLDRELPRLRGKPQKYAFDRIGYPDRRMIIGAETVYSWVNTDTDGDGGTLTCTVKIIVSRGVVVKTDYNGNRGACRMYATVLDPSFHER